MKFVDRIEEKKRLDDVNTEHLLNTLTEKAKKLPFSQNKKIVPVLFLKSNKKYADNIFLPEQVLKMI